MVWRGVRGVMRSGNGEWCEEDLGVSRSGKGEW